MPKQIVDLEIRAKIENLKSIKSQFDKLTRNGIVSKEDEKQLNKATRQLKQMDGELRKISALHRTRLNTNNKISASLKEANKQLKLTLDNNRNIISRLKENLESKKRGYAISVEELKLSKERLSEEKRIAKNTIADVKERLKNLSAQRKAMKSLYDDEIKSIERRNKTLTKGSNSIGSKKDQLKQQKIELKSVEQRNKLNRILLKHLDREKKAAKDITKLEERQLQIQEAKNRQKLIEQYNPLVGGGMKTIGQMQDLERQAMEKYGKNMDALKRGTPKDIGMMAQEEETTAALDRTNKKLNETMLRRYRIMGQNGLKMKDLNNLTVMRTNKLKDNIEKMKQKIAADEKELQNLNRRKAALEQQRASDERIQQLERERVNLSNSLTSSQERLLMVEDALAANQEEVNESARRYNQEIRLMSAGVSTAESAQAALNSQLERQTNAMKRGNRFIREAASYFVSFFSGLALFGMVRRTIEDAMRYLIDLDKALIEIATVSGQTREEVLALGNEFNEVAKKLGRSTVEVAKSAVIFYRQGLEYAEVMSMVEATTIAAALANTDLEEAASKMTASLKAYKIEAKDALTVSDRFSALAANTASSFDELSTALGKVNVNWPYLKGILSYN